MNGLYPKGKNRIWYMCFTANGRKFNRSTHTSNKRAAQRILNAKLGEIAEGRFHLPRSKPPLFEKWADEFLETIRHPNTKRVYKSCIKNLKAHFGKLRLNQITVEEIEQFKRKRLKA